MGRRAVVLVIALLLAGAAAFAVFQYLRSVELEARENQAMVQVYRAVDAIPEGFDGSQVLQAPDVLYIQNEDQAADIPEDAIRPDDLNDALTGKVAVGPISANGILTYSQWVTPTISITPLKDLIEPGKQAVTVSPGDVQGVNGFPQAGDLVNVIVTIDIPLEETDSGFAVDFGVPTDEATSGDEEVDPGSALVPYTRFVLQNLKVLATGTEVVGLADGPQNVTVQGEVGADTVTGEAEGTVQEADPAEAQASTIFTLEVDPNQAERLVYAVEQGSIYLTLAPDDNQEVATQGVKIDDLFEGELLDDIFRN